MRFKFLDILPMLCVLMMLAGCGPLPSPTESPLPTVLPTSTVPTPEICPTDAQAICRLTGDNEALEDVTQKLLDKDPDFGNQACESLMDLDLGRTYVRFPSAVFWTFHLNFREFDDGLPVACLKFYWRDNQHKTFVESKHNIVLIPCSIAQNEDVFFEKPIPLTSSLGGRKGVASNSVDLLKGGHIECPVDIRLSEYNLIQNSQFRPDVESIGLNVTDTISITVEAQKNYTNPDIPDDFFTAATAIASLSAKSNQNHYPLIYYEPHLLCQAKIGPSCGGVTEFSVTDENQELSFATTLAGREYKPNKPAMPVCSDPGESCLTEPIPENSESVNVSYLWDDFGKLIQPFDYNDNCLAQPISDTHYLQFVWESPNGNFGACSNKNLVQETPQGPIQKINQDSIQFWLGPATIYIGYRPDTKEYLEGKLYEVWVDPDSATPPKQLTKQPK